MQRSSVSAESQSSQRKAKLRWLSQISASKQHFIHLYKEHNLCSLKISIFLQKRDNPIISMLVNSLVEIHVQDHIFLNALCEFPFVSLFMKAFSSAVLITNLYCKFLPFFEGPVQPRLPHGTFSDHFNPLGLPSSLSSYSSSIFL